MFLQEEVENRTVSFVVSTSKMSLRVILAAIRRVLHARGYRVQQKKSAKRQIKTRVKAVKKEEKVRRKNDGPRGKQTVRQLMRHSNGLKKMTVEAREMRDFEKILKKYGVDYSFVMDVTSPTPKYLFFFKARDAEILNDVYKECVAKRSQKARHHEQEHSL